MTTTVSVALCTYNGERFIAEQLRSIIEQSPPPTQIVVSDDGSTDGTVAIVEAVLAASGIDSLILRGAQPLGVVKNFERAVRATTGGLVVLCDQDDVWHAGRLATAVADLGRDPSILLWHSDARLIDERGTPLDHTLYQSLGISTAVSAAINSGDAFAQYLRRNLATGATTVFRRTLLDAALPFPVQWVHDEWLAIVAAATGRVRSSDSALIDYRQHSSNAIGVARPTIRHKLARMLEPRGTRYSDLAARSETLVIRLEQISASREVLALALGKRDFERRRREYPARRIARVRAVLHGALRGDYSRFSSQGVLDIVRDLVQPA